MQHQPTPVLAPEPRVPSPPHFFGNLFGTAPDTRRPAAALAASTSAGSGLERATSNPFLVQPNGSGTHSALHAANRVRFDDGELARPEQAASRETMELDLPLFFQRPGGGELGRPLGELDINRVRFPNALRRDPLADLPQPPNEYTLYAGNTPGPSRPIPIRSPTPWFTFGNGNNREAGGAPGTADLYGNAALSPSNARPRTPAPITMLGARPPTPFHPSAGGTVAVSSNATTMVQGEDALALLYDATPALDPAYAFTPTPPGGFPEVAWQDPEALFYGLPRPRMVAMLNNATGTRLALQVYNLGFPQPAELRQVTNAIIGALQAVTGELDILAVPPERDEGDVRGSQPLTWLILGLSTPSYRLLLTRGVLSCFTITVFVYAAEIRIPRLLGTIGGFAHDHGNSIFMAVRAVLSGPRVFPHILQLVATNPTYVGTRPEIAARAILSSLQVRVAMLQNGNLIAAVFIDSPTQSVGRWRDWRNVIAALPFPSPLNSTGRFRRHALCAGCHGADHPTHLCPFPDVPGWNAPPPGAQWAHPGQQLPGIAAGGHQPPPPPPPGAPYAASSTTAPHGRGRGSRALSRSADVRGKRIWRGGSFGDENRPY